MTTDGHELRCEEVLEHLFEYLDRELDAETSSDIEHHLRHCRDCFSRSEFERRLKQRVAETGSAEAPERMRRRLLQLIARF